MRKEKEEEEEIRRVWPFYVLSLSPSKQKKSSKTGNRCNQYKQPTVNGSAVTEAKQNTYDGYICLLA